jgi:SAM-dependent methyltransferase
VSYVPSDYWERLLAGQHDESGVGYPSLAVSFNAAMYRALTGQVDWLLRRGGLLDPPPRRVLDVGSGTGAWVRFWLDHGVREVVGVDLTQAAVKRLAGRFPDTRFERADVSEGLPEGPFDAVSAMSVLLHVTDAARWRAALANLAGALAPDGFALLIEPLVVHRWWGPPFDASSNSVARPRAEW